MTDTELFLILCKLNQSTNSVEHLGSGFRKYIFNEETWKQAIHDCEGTEFQFDASDFSIEVNYSSTALGFKVYDNIDSFINRTSASELENKIAVLPSETGNGFLFLDNNQIITFPNNSSITSIKNVIAYIRIEDFLHSYVADYYDSGSQKMIFINPVLGAVGLTSNGRKFAYELTDISLDDAANNLLTAIPTNNAIPFLKYEITRVISDIPENDRLFHFLTHIDLFIERSLQQIEISHANIELDDFINKFNTKTEKYLDAVHSALGKIGATLISMPVTIGGSIFATFQFELPLITITSGSIYVAYSIFAIFYQIFAWQDIGSLNSQLKEDKKNILYNFPLASSSFLTKTDRVQDRILFIRICIILLIILLTVFATFIFCISINEFQRLISNDTTSIQELNIIKNSFIFLRTFF